MRVSLGWRMLLDLLNQIPLALEDANFYFFLRAVSHSHGGQTPGFCPPCHSPLENSHRDRRAPQEAFHFFKREGYRSLKYFISNSGKVLLAGLACQTLFSRALAMPEASDNSTALHLYSADNSSVQAMAWIENSVKPEYFAQLIQDVPRFEYSREKFEGISRSVPRIKREISAERRRKILASIRSNLINNDVCLINAETITMPGVEVLPKFSYFALSSNASETDYVFLKKFECKINIPLVEQLTDGRWAFKVHSHKNTTFLIQHTNTREYLCLDFYTRPKVKARVMSELSNLCLWNVILHPGKKLSITLQDLYGGILGADDFTVNNIRKEAHVKSNHEGSRWYVKICNPEYLDDIYDIKDLNDIKGLGNVSTNLQLVLLNKSEAEEEVSHRFSVGTISSLAGTGLICYFLVMYILIYRRVYKDDRKRLKNISQLQHEENQAMVNQSLAACLLNKVDSDSREQDACLIPAVNGWFSFLGKRAHVQEQDPPILDSMQVNALSVRV